MIWTKKPFTKELRSPSILCQKSFLSLFGTGKMNPAIMPQNILIMVDFQYDLKKSTPEGGFDF